MLCLKQKTNAAWIQSALMNLDSVLIDHAHCEKKAASTGLSLIASYPEKEELLFLMSDLVKEEISHFKSVIEILKKRNLSLIKDKGDHYVKKLLSTVNKNEPERLLDRLLTAAIIEARSCERLKLLADNLNDNYLKKFYSALSYSEAAHYMAFVKLAKKYFDDNLVKARLDYLTDFEKYIVNSLPNHPLMHG